MNDTVIVLLYNKEMSVSVTVHTTKCVCVCVHNVNQCYIIEEKDKEHSKGDEKAKKTVLIPSVIK